VVDSLPGCSELPGQPLVKTNGDATGATRMRRADMIETRLTDS
jgi:hypothetical protein